MPEWTRQQQDAIYARQGTLLVSAAAGSGKTAVLVERILQAVLDEEHPANVDEFLVVTFTNAAAAEMRQRIGAGLSEAMGQNGSNPRLIRQQMLLPGAHICTIDAFCIQLVREHFSQLPIEQDFRILDDAALSLLKAQALDEVLSGQYAEGNPAFLSLVELLSGARDDRKLGDAVEKLYDYIMAHPFPKQWLAAMCGRYRDGVSLQDSPWGTLIREHAMQSLQYGISQIAGAVSLAEQEETLREKLRPVLDADLAAVKSLYDTLKQDGWDASRRALQEFSMARMPVIRGYKEHPLKLAAAARRETVKKIILECRELFDTGEAEHRADMLRLQPLVEALADTVRQFYDRLLELKQQENAYSFGDIEHFALRLLVRQAQDGYAPTQLAQQMQARYREILVDEYQDTNRAQDLLFEALSGGDNLFMVGDVKQSIYRFRQAMPKIFMEKKRAFVPYDRNAPAFPARIALDRNFRSRASVCDFVNFTFGLLMSESVGELDYRGEERLQAGASYPSGDEDCVQLHLLDTSSAAKGEKGRYEAAYIAGLIQEMVNSAKTVVDHGVELPFKK
ncbi:MAG: UvrD-helicase domain-containing protein [Clostridiales bacterium]|nr:UvrD-helicase domain-containing protein [Clostridiales bacterium]